MSGRLQRDKSQLIAWPDRGSHLLRRANVDADSHAAARIVIHLGRILLTVVGIYHTVSIDSLFLVSGLTRLATRYRPRVLRRLVA